MHKQRHKAGLKGRLFALDPSLAKSIGGGTTFPSVAPSPRLASHPPPHPAWGMEPEGEVGLMLRWIC